MRKSLIVVLMLVIAMGMFTACGKDKKVKLTEDSVVLNKNGSIDVIMVEEFNQPQYNEAELMEMVNNEVTAYNNLHGSGSLKVKSNNLKDGKMTIKMAIASSQVYNDYMGDVVHKGTISSAYSAGFDLNRSLVNVKKKGSTIGKAELTNMPDEKVFVVNKATTVRVPSKIKYYSQGMEMLDDYTVKSSENGCYFIMY